MGNNPGKTDGSSSSHGRSGGQCAAEAAALDELYMTASNCKFAQLAGMWDDSLDKYLKQLTLNYIAPKSEGQRLNRSRFYKFFQKLVRGTDYEAAEVVFDILTCCSKPDTIVRQMSNDYVESLIRSYLATCSNSGWEQSSKAEVTQLAHSLCLDLAAESSPDEFVRWMASATKVLSIQHAVFSRLNPVRVPRVQLYPRSTNSNNSTSILTLTSVIFANTSLPAELRSEWRLLYTSQKNGESFSKLLECIQKKGPTVLVVRDRGGGVFGGFASVPWALSPKFVGDSNSFLYKLKPTMTVYSASNFNSNYQYLNMGQQTMPNGLGMGGQLGFFGLWLDGEYGYGHSSESCTTFRDHRTLSTSKEFAIDVLEVWSVGPDESKPEHEPGQRSVLDGNTEARAMLEMLGKKAHSDGYREPPE